jgi:4-carboxymuconolactone decarboxylase
MLPRGGAGEAAMADGERRRRGRESFERVMGFPAPALEGDPFYDATLEHLFAEVWSRPALGVRERRLVTLTVLAGLGHEPTLRMHLGAALRSGDLSDAELDEWLLHLAHYAGWPAAAVASQVLRALRAERDARG